MLVTVNALVDTTSVIGPIAPARSTSATAATDTDNKVYWLFQTTT